MRARFLPSILFGLTTAIVAAAAWIVVMFVLPIAIAYLAFRSGDDNVGGATAQITTNSILLALVFGFASGFFWRLRRLSP